MNPLQRSDNSGRCGGRVGGSGRQARRAAPPSGTEDAIPTPALEKMLLCCNQTKVRMLPFSVCLFVCWSVGLSVEGAERTMGEVELAGEGRVEVSLELSSSVISFITRTFSKFGAPSMYISLEVIFSIACPLNRAKLSPKGVKNGSRGVKIVIPFMYKAQIYLSIYLSIHLSLSLSIYIHTHTIHK